MNLQFNVVTEVWVNNPPNLNDVEEHLKRLIERLALANNLSTLLHPILSRQLTNKEISFLS